MVADVGLSPVAAVEPARQRSAAKQSQTQVNRTLKGCEDCVLERSLAGSAAATQHQTLKRVRNSLAISSRSAIG